MHHKTKENLQAWAKVIVVITIISSLIYIISFGLGRGPIGARALKSLSDDVKRTSYKEATDAFIDASSDGKISFNEKHNINRILKKFALQKTVNELKETRDNIKEKGVF